jgi:hypothetical protein
VGEARRRARAQHPAAGQRLQHLDRALERDAGQLGDVPWLGVVAQDHERLRDRAPLRGGGGHAGLDRVGDRLGRERVHARRRVAASRELVGERAHEPRVAAGRLERGLGELALHRPAEPVAQQGRDAGHAEREEPQAGDRRVRHHSGERRRQLGLPGAGGDHDHERQRVQPGAEHRQQVQGLVVEPVGVVDGDHQRAALLAQCAEQGDHAEQPRLRGLGRSCRRFGPVGEHSPSRRGWAREGRLADRRNGGGEHAAGPAERVRALQLRASNGEDGQASLHRRGAGGVEHRGLAHPGRPLDQQGGTVAVRHPLERLSEGGDLFRALVQCQRPRKATEWLRIGWRAPWTRISTPPPRPISSAPGR